MSESGHNRRSAIGAGGVGIAGGLIAAAAAGASLIDPKAAYAQAAGDSLLRTVLDRGQLIVGTGSTNAPWHFEDEQGELVGMDIAMARILAKGLFDDETKVEFVLQDPAARIPNMVTGKVDITIQFMTVTPQPGPARELHPALLHRGRGAADQARQPAREVGRAAGRRGRTPRSRSCRTSTPRSASTRCCRRRRCCSSTPRPTSSRRWRPAASTPPRSTSRRCGGWPSAQPDKYADAGYSWNSMLYAAALRQGDLDWLQLRQHDLRRRDVRPPERDLRQGRATDFFGLQPPVREFGLPKF